MNSRERDLIRPPIWRRAWFYLGGALPRQYTSWAEAKLSSRWRFLLQHVAGSIALLVCVVIPLSLVLGLDRGQVTRVSLTSLAGILVGSILFSERFRRYSLKRLAREPSDAPG